MKDRAQSGTGKTSAPADGGEAKEIKATTSSRERNMRAFLSSGAAFIFVNQSGTLSAKNKAEAGFKPVKRQHYFIINHDSGHIISASAFIKEIP